MASQTTATNKSLCLVLGGARSGKSHYAETQLEAETGELIYIATAQAFDDEMRNRIQQHRARRSARWQTLEAAFDLGNTLRQADNKPILVDCLTLWLSNLLLAEHDLATAIADLEQALSTRRASTLLVANEVGLGIVPNNALARRFRDQAGQLNQRLAAQAGRVVLVTAGLPLILKDSL